MPLTARISQRQQGELEARVRLLQHQLTQAEAVHDQRLSSANRRADDAAERARKAEDTLERLREDVGFWLFGCILAWAVPNPPLFAYPPSRS